MGVLVQRLAGHASPKLDSFWTHGLPARQQLAPHCCDMHLHALPTSPCRCTTNSTTTNSNSGSRGRVGSRAAAHLALSARRLQLLQLLSLLLFDRLVLVHRLSTREARGEVDWLT